MEENSGVTSGESCDMNESRLNVSDEPNDRNTVSRAASVCNRLPASSASSDEQGGRVLKDRVQTAMHERRRNPTLHILSKCALIPCGPTRDPL